jgi:hypothetical protein
MFKIVIVFLLFTINGNAQYIGFDIEAGQSSSSIKTGTDVLQKMYSKYKHASCKSYTFSQKNKHYKNDSLTGASEWYEAIEFPDKFRIDFGDKSKGNFVIFKNDSLFRYSTFELKKAIPDTNNLLLLIGGMYYRELNDVLLRLQKASYQTQIVSKQKFKKQKVYVIGALKGDTLSNQIWVSKKNYRVVRIIERMDATHTMDMTFDAFTKHCHGYVETAVTFKNNGKIEQVEVYYDIKTVEVFGDEVFNPKKF